MSLDTGTFSGNQKLPVNRSHTSASFSSCRRFQLIAETRSISFIPPDTRTPFRGRGSFADSPPKAAAGAPRAYPDTPPGVRHRREPRHLVWGCRLRAQKFVLRSP